jgi:hypothetical protein
MKISIGIILVVVAWAAMGCGGTQTDSSARLDEIEQRLDSQEDRESVIWQQVDANTETIDGMLMPTE